MTSISFTVLGKPVPRGSKRGFPIRRANGSVGVAMSDDNTKSRDWMNAVRECARQAYGGELLDGPISLSVDFYLPRPKGHFGKRGLLGSAPLWPTTKPDVDKCLRAIGDSLTGVIYRDDSQVIEMFVRKFYGEPARAEIQIDQVKQVTQKGGLFA